MAYINPYEREQRRKAEQTELQRLYAREEQGGTPASAPVEGEEPGIGRRAFDTVLDVRNNIGIGAWGSIEGMVDSLVLGPIGAVGGIFSSRFADTMKKAIQYNVTEDFLFPLYNDMHRAGTGGEFDSGETSYLRKDGTVNSIARGIGGMLPAVAVSVATMGAAAPAAAGSTAASAGGSAMTAAQAAKLAQALSTVTMAAGAAGQAEQEAYQDGADFYGGQAYGVLRGATEAATEYALGGTTKLITGGGKAMLPGVRRSVASVGLKRVAKAALEEGLEEGISESLDPLTRTTYKGKEALAEYADPAFYGQVLKAVKDGSLTGLVFQGTVGHAMGNTGKAADMREIRDELDTLEKKRRNLHKNNTLTDEAEAAIGADVRENYRVMEGVLKKATPEKRAALMEEYGLSGEFDENGAMKADFAALLDRRATVGQTAPDGENGAPAGSAGLTGSFDRRTASVDAEAEKVAKVLSKEGREQFTDVDSLSREGQKNLRDVKRVMEVFQDISDGAVGEFVIAKESVSDNAYFDPETGYTVIGADALENGINVARKGVQSWFQTALHEAAHGGEGTDSHVKLSAILRHIGGGKYYTEMLKLLGSRGYWNGKASDIRAEMEKIIRKVERGEALTDKQTALANVIASEGTSIMAELALGNEHFARELLDADASIVEKLLNRIAEVKEALARRKDAAAKEAFEELRAAEGVFLEALAEKGMAFVDGKIVGASEEDEVKKSKTSSEKTAFTIDKYYERQIDRWRELKEGSYITVGDIKEHSALSKVGMPQGRLYFDVSKIRKEMEKHSDHLSPDIMKKIPELLNEPIVITEYNPGKNTNTVNVFGRLFAQNSNNTPIFVGIVATKGRGGTVVTKIRTVHTRSDWSDMITDDSVLYLNENKKETDKWFQARGNSVPLGGTKYGLVRSISLVEQKVNPSDKISSENSSGDVKKSKKTIDPAKRKAMANLTHQKVYNKADAANIVNSFIVEDADTQSKDKDVRRMERELKGKIIDFVWDRLNMAVSKPKQGIEAFAMAEKIVIYLHRDELMWQMNPPIETVAEQLFNMDLSIHQYAEEKNIIAKQIEKAYGDYGKESRRAKQDQKVERLKKKYADPITRNDRTNTIVKLAMDLFNWKNEVFFNHTNISDVDLFRRTLGKLTGTRYHGYFNEEGARKCIEEYGKWYLSEATEKILGKGESWSVYSEEIAEKIRSVANGKGDLTTADLDDIIAILQDAKAVSEAYGTVFKNGKRVKAIDVAKEEAATVTANANIKMGFMDWLFRRYGAEFGEPGSLFRYIDRYRPGFLTEFFERFRKDSIQAQKHEYEMISLLDEVLRNKKYRGYLQDAHKRTVEYRDGTGTTYHIPADIATALYMSLMTPANAGMLAPSGFAYKDPKTGKTIRPCGFMIGFDPYEIDPDTKRVRVKQEVIEAAEEQAAKLYEQFTEADMEYISAVETAFEKCGELKSQTDIARRGWTNTMKGYYFPAKTAFTAKQLGDYRIEIQSVAQKSFNKNRTEGNQHELWFESLDTIARSHIHGVSVYAALGKSIDDFDLLYHMDVSGNPNKPISIRTKLAEVWPGGKDAMEKFIEKWKKDIQGISDQESSDWAKTFEKIRGNVAVAAITGNLKVLLSQVSSYFAAANVIDTGMLFKGMNLTIGRDVDEYSTLAMIRHKNNEAALAQGVLDKLDGVHDFLSKPIGWMDRRVVVRLFTACQYQIAKDQKLKLGTEENKKAAGELLERVILETQQNALATEKSAAMRSKNPILRTFVMFSADSMKQMARLLDGLGEIATLKAEAKFFNRGVNKDRMRGAQKKTARAAGVLAVQAVYMVAIAQLIQWALKKDEDKEPEEIAKDLAVDFFGSILGGLPVIRDIYDGITQGYGTEDMSISAFNDMVSSVKDLLDMAKDIASGELTGRNAAGTIRKALYAIGNVAGIPVRNVDRYADGLIRWVAPNAAYKKDNAFSVQPYRSDIARAIEREDEGRLETVIGVMLDENVGEVTSSAVRQEMKRLVVSGLDVLPRGVGETVTVDGESVKLTARQKTVFKAVYSEANKSVERMVGLAYYSNASDEAKAKAIKRVYGIYYNRAIEDLLGVELENKNTLLSRAINPEVLAVVMAVCGEITADVGKDGKVVAGSKRKKVEAFVESLKLKAAQKYMIMGALGYKNKKGKEKVLAYVNGLGLSKSEREAIMAYSGY